MTGKGGDMNARQTIVDILERGEATLVIHVRKGVVTDVTLDGLEIPYTLHDYVGAYICPGCFADAKQKGE